jgi:hypothetical protein
MRNAPAAKFSPADPHWWWARAYQASDGSFRVGTPVSLCMHQQWKHGLRCSPPLPATSQVG